MIPLRGFTNLWCYSSLIYVNCRSYMCHLICVVCIQFHCFCIRVNCVQCVVILTRFVNRLHHWLYLFNVGDAILKVTRDDDVDNKNEDAGYADKTSVNVIRDVIILSRVKEPTWRNKQWSESCHKYSTLKQFTGSKKTSSLSRWDHLYYRFGTHPITRVRKIAPILGVFLLNIHV